MARMGLPDPNHQPACIAQFSGLHLRARRAGEPTCWQSKRRLPARLDEQAGGVMKSVNGVLAATATPSGLEIAFGLGLVIIGAFYYLLLKGDVGKDAFLLRAFPKWYRKIGRYGSATLVAVGLFVMIQGMVRLGLSFL